jgi:hypothetical protein
VHRIYDANQATIAIMQQVFCVGVLFPSHQHIDGDIMSRVGQIAVIALGAIGVLIGSTLMNLLDAKHEALAQQAYKQACTTDLHMTRAGLEDKGPCAKLATGALAATH